MTAALGGFVAVGCGAALGAWLRWGLSIWLNDRHAWIPMGTLLANLIGGYGIGLAIAWLTFQTDISPQWRLFLVTGLLGGLTTFSSYSAEVVGLIQGGSVGQAVALAMLHLMGSLLLTWLGIITIRGLVA